MRSHRDYLKVQNNRDINQIDIPQEPSLLISFTSYQSPIIRTPRTKNEKDYEDSGRILDEKLSMTMVGNQKF